jgi:pimeloyl-ACP methyl ester carboxylesterase
MTIAYAQVNGHRIRYRLQGNGDGPIVVFGHGLLGSIDQVEQHAPGLDTLFDRVRLLLYDARGHGESEGPEDPAGYTWETLGRDMATLCELHGEEQAVFGGGSMGAATSLWVALEQPERVRALVLAMPPPLGRQAMRAQEERAAITTLDFLAAAIQNYGLEQTVEIARQAPGFASTPEEAEERANWLLSQNPRTILHAIRGLLTAPYHDPDDYRRIKVPTLVVAHEGDGLHPVRAAKLIADRVPGAKLLVGDRPGYWRDNPSELHAELRAFLDRIA